MKFSIPVYLKKIFINRKALYLIFGLSLLQWVYLLSSNRSDLIIVFSLISFLLYFLNKNMIFVLGIPLIIVSIKMNYPIEGFEGSSEEKNESDKKENTGKKQKKENKKSTEIISPPVKNDENDNEKNEGDNDQDPEFDSNQINYASTLTNNMKSYNEILGSDGFAKMTQDTQQLLIQQEQLGNAMKEFAPLIGQMTPFLEKASGLLNNMDMKQINNVANVFKN